METHAGGYSRALRLLRVSSGGLQRRLLRPRGEDQADAYCAKRNGGGPDEEPGITVERIEYRSSGPGAESHADG